MIIKLKTYQVIALIVAVVFLLWIVFRGPNNNPSNEIDKRQVDSVIAVKDSIEKYTTHIIDSLVSNNNRRSKVQDSLAKVIDKTEDQLEVKSLTASALAKEVKLYEKYKDTVAQLRAAPLLADEVIGLTEEVAVYKKQNRTLRNSIDSSVGATSLIMARKDYQLSELQGQFDFLAGKYSKLDYNYNSLNKKLKREKTLSRILGGALLILGGAYLAK